MKSTRYADQNSYCSWLLQNARWDLSLLAIGAMAFFMVGNASANVQMEHDPFDSLQVIEDQELDQLRGGFEFRGLQFEFGANIRTFIDGVLALESVISIAKDGMITQQNPATQINPDTTTGITNQLSPDILMGGITADTVVDSDLNPQATVDLTGVADANGIVIQDVKGYTAALHQVRRDQILSLIVNTASGRDLRQELDVNVTVDNFRQFQRSVRDSILNGRLGNNRLP